MFNKIPELVSPSCKKFLVLDRVVSFIPLQSLVLLASPHIVIMSQIEDLVEHYKNEAGSLPCKLLLNAPRRQSGEAEGGAGEKRGRGKYSAKRRRKHVDIDEMLIVN